METETMETFKLVAMYALEVVVVAAVGATVLAGLYQLIRDRVRSLSASASRRRPAVERVPKGT
jgi:hypothetical protein